MAVSQRLIDRAVITLTIASSCLVLTLTAKAEHVNGYYKANGHYVQGYERTSPDHNLNNNYGSPTSYERQYHVPAAQRDRDGDGIPNWRDNHDDRPQKMPCQWPNC